MENHRDTSAAVVSRVSFRSSRSNSSIFDPNSDRGSSPRTASFRTSWPQLSPPNLSDTGRVQQAHSSSSPPRTNVFLLPRAPSALCQSEPGGSTSPRVDGASLRQKGGPTHFQSPAGPQFSESPIRSFLRAKYGGKIPGADARLFPAACSVGVFPTSEESPQLGHAFCFENALRGACSPTCPVDSVQVSRQAVPPKPWSSAPLAAAIAASAKPLPDYSFAVAAAKAVGEAGENLASCVTFSKQRFPYATSDTGGSPQGTGRHEEFPWKPVMVRDSTTYCVVFKPAFWTCCCCGLDLNFNERLSTSPYLKKEMVDPSFGCPSVVQFLQQFFSQQQAPALYSREVRYGVVYHLDESWSGFVLVAKTFGTFEAFAKQLRERQIHVKLECLLATDQNQVLAHNCKLHSCRTSSGPTSRPPPQFRLCAPPHYEKTYYSKEGTKLGNETDLQDPENSVQGAGNKSWHHVVLACCLQPAPPAAVAASPFRQDEELPEVTALFWKTRRRIDSSEKDSTQANTYKWRSFCHGSYLSFYDCDAKEGAPDTLTMTASSLSKNHTARFEIRPLCTFEAALPSDLQGILTQLQQSNSFPADQQQPQQQQQRKMALLAYFRQPLSPDAKLKLLAGCIVVLSIGVAANTPWFHRKKAEWGWLQRGFSKIFLQAAQGVGSLALCGAAAWRGLLCSGASLANQLQDARYFVINVLWGGSSDSVIDPAVGI